jgi:hypothetical protein
LECQGPTRQANTIKGVTKLSPRQFAGPLNGELDARRAAVDRQDAWIRGLHASPSLCNPNEASFSHVDL